MLNTIGFYLKKSKLTEKLQKYKNDRRIFGQVKIFNIGHWKKLKKVTQIHSVSVSTQKTSEKGAHIKILNIILILLLNNKYYIILNKPA